MKRWCLLTLLSLSACAEPPATRPETGREGASPRGDAGLRALQTGPSGTYLGSLPTAGIGARFDDDGALLDDDGDGGLRVRLRGLSGEALPPAVQPVLGACARPDAESTRCVRRLEYARPGVTEWWVSRNEGMQQGFLVHGPPADGGPLTLSLALEGAVSLTVAETQDRAEALDRSGAPWRVSDLSAWDADGLPLDIWMEAEAGGLALRVEASDARYPVTIDPVYSRAASTLTGAEAMDGFGIDVSGVGDLNADGYADVTVTSLYYSTDVGQVDVYLGGPDGLTSEPIATLSDDNAGAGFGQNVDAAGDVNGDGYDDLIVGASTTNETYTYGGAAYVYLGSADGVETTPATTIEGTETGDQLGANVAGAGDVNGDGYDDVMVYLFGASAYQGEVHLYLGSAAGVDLSTKLVLNDATEANASFGRGLSSAGDIDNDGYDDIAIGAPVGADTYGQVYVYRGSADGLVTPVHVVLEGATVGSAFGSAVARGGDIDLDGYDDLIVSAYSTDAVTGAVQIYLGSAAGMEGSVDIVLGGSTPSGGFGWKISGGGDLNGDHHADLVVSSYFVESATVYHGQDGGVDTEPAVVLEPSILDSGYAYDVDMVGDVNGDGFDDVLLGSYGNNDATGAAYLYLGYPQDEDEDGWTVDLDCDDEDGAISPDAAEITGDGVDQDCDRQEDCYQDADDDGARTGELVVSGDEDCDDAGEGLSADLEDCDDADDDVYPGAPERCNSVDDDCDGSLADEEEDRDGDGLAACDGDCDDGDPTISPEQEEVAGDAIDQDCDGLDGSVEPGEGEGEGEGEDDKSGGCGCASAGEPAPMFGLVGLGLALALRRRAPATRSATPPSGRR